MRLVSVEMLKPDMKLVFPLYHENTLVMPAGRDHIEKYCINLEHMGIRYVYIEDKLSEGIEVPDVLDLETRTQCKGILKRVMDHYHTTSIFKIRELTSCVDDMIKDILRNKDMMLSLNDYAPINEYTYLHSVNVTVYALLMGEALGYPIPVLRELALGAILHDIGKTVMDLGSQEKEGILTEAEYNLMKKHAEYGYEILEGVGDLSKRAREIAWMHHEKLDGTGYPQGLQEEAIPIFAQIVCIADVYDALTSDRCYRDKWPAVTAMKYLQEHAGTEFSQELVDLFFQKIAVYPNGSLVRLSTGMFGIIMEQSKNLPLQPIVRVCYDKSMKEIEPFELDLSNIKWAKISQSELELSWNKKHLPRV
ncbi:MAG: HD-GYP domain-containing protein [Eubacteriales bacterium]